MSKEINCSICGLKMKRLSLQLWQCKCGRREMGGEGEEEEDEEEEAKEEQERRLRFEEKKEGRFREQAQQYHKGLKRT
jgi:ribosomal protein L37AE/L43A